MMCAIAPFEIIVEYVFGWRVYSLPSKNQSRQFEMICAVLVAEAFHKSVHCREQGLGDALLLEQHQSRPALSMGRDGRDGCLSFSLHVCLSGKRFIFLVMQRPALNISV